MIQYQNQEPRMVPEPRTKNGAGTKKQAQWYMYSVPQGIYRESAFGREQSLVKFSLDRSVR